MIYVRWFPGDYLRDTTHLSLLEDGAYRRLLDLYYTTGRALTADRERLYRQLRITDQAEKDAIERVLAEFFFEHRGTLHNQRASKELRRSREISDMRANAAKQKAKVAANAKHVQSISSAIPYPEPEPEPEPEERRTDRPPQDQVSRPVQAVEKPTAATVSAFQIFGVAPFGPPAFQRIFVEQITGAFNQQRTNGDVYYAEALERCIQICKNKHIAVPRIFFDHKYEVERIELLNRNKRTPL